MEWQQLDGPSPGDDLREVVGGHPLVATILARRGIIEPEQARAFLYPEHYRPAPPTELPDVDKSAHRLLEAVQASEKILVWGDFDVDGQTSTSLLVDALRALGADVLYQVPHRMKHGHGVDVPLLKEYLEQGVNVVLTCDTGIAAHEAVEAARQAGVAMLITDHHALPPTLPPADALVNPQRLPAGHPLRDLPGVGVTYKLIQHLYKLAGRVGEEEQFLDLVALGIVADVATQQRDTRYLLQKGIDRLRTPRRIGLQSLMERAQVDTMNLSSDTIGFQIGPRLNALGRLDDATLAVRLLTTDQRSVAEQIVVQLEALNNRRKQIQDQITAAALEQIEQDPSLIRDFEAVVLYGERWHPGVVGIVASRIVELYGKPAVLLTGYSDDNVARGSARSVPGVDIGASIAALDEMLLGHGGHPGAAGCAMDADLVPQFRRRLSNVINDTRDTDVVAALPIDAEISLGELSMDLAEDLDRIGPFGEGNPPIRLMTTGLKITADAVFGAGNKHRRITVEDPGGESYMVTWWRGADYPTPTGIIDLVYIPRINDYKGRRSLQLEWVDSRPTPGVEVEVKAGIEIVDLRSISTPENRLDPKWPVWAEGFDTTENIPFETSQIVNRYSAQPADNLIIWTVPSGPLEVKQMVDKTSATSFYIVAEHQPVDKPEAFLKRLAGLTKYALKNYGGEVSVLKIAGATGQREVTVRRGLEWMTARGQISLEWQDGDHVLIHSAGEAQPEEIEPLQDALRALLAETRAFRTYFRTGQLESFIDP